MPELLQEYVDSGSHRLRVDRTAGVIRGVKLLGLRSRNGRRYRQQALADAIALYEGAKVNVNHPKGHPLAPRDYQDRLGVIAGVELRTGEGLFADLCFNPKHALSEQLMWDAEHASQNVGLSHNVLAQTRRERGETVVEAITKVQSIDLVADPATTRGLFEQQGDASSPKGGQAAPIEWDELTIEQLRLNRPDLLEELEQTHALLLEDMQAQLDEYATRDRARRRREQIADLLHEYGLPAPDSRDDSARAIVSERFLETLTGTKNEQELRRLIEDRATLVRSASRWQNEGRQKDFQPVSRDQLTVVPTGGGSRTRNAKQFAAAVQNL